MVRVIMLAVRTRIHLDDGGGKAGIRLEVEAPNAARQVTRLPVLMLRDKVRELRDALNEYLGEPHVTGDEVHTVASTARDLALEEAAHVALFRSQVTADAILALRSPERRGG